MTELEMLVERDRISRLVFRYAERLDARDAAGVAACFTDDAHLSFNDGALHYDGRAAIADVYGVALGPGPTANGSVTTHLTSNVVIDLADDGRTATGTVKVVAFLVRPEGLAVRGLHFDDEFVKTDEGWRFATRAHRADWQSLQQLAPVSIPRFATATPT